MIEVLITFLLIMGLNIPVFFELYKHILKQRPLAVQIIITVAYWAGAFITQTLVAFVAIIFLYMFYYRNAKQEETLRNSDVWHISAISIVIIIALSIGARALLGAINFIYVVVLDQILHYDIKAQEIVTYYSQARLWLKGLLSIEIVLIAPIVEEFVFRFFLYGKLLVERMPKFMAALISAGLFTLLHFNVSGVPTFFGLGLLCVLMYEKKGYWGAVTAHGVSNAVTLILLYYF
jgi:membrane protease YdiL (CAAX protease family)